MAQKQGSSRHHLKTGYSTLIYSNFCISFKKKNPDLLPPYFNVPSILG